MANKKPATENITVKISLETVPDSARAAELFRRMLRAVREQTDEDQRKQDSAGKSAA
jgi:hypothetical protein